MYVQILIKDVKGEEGLFSSVDQGKRGSACVVGPLPLYNYAI